MNSISYICITCSSFSFYYPEIVTFEVLKSTKELKKYLSSLLKKKIEQLLFLNRKFLLILKNVFLQINLYITTID